MPDCTCRFCICHIFWDEAGYYIPAAHDLLLTGNVIPQSTPSNAHPPLVTAYLALCWKVIGYDPVVTRCATLVVAAFALLGLFRLAETIANREVAVASTLCTAIYPVFFAQSSLAHLDLAAAGLTFWALYAYSEERFGATAFWFSLAVLAKETAVIAPLALFGWHVIRYFLRRSVANGRERWMHSAFLLVPALPLASWYIYHYSRTGVVFGNPEFFRYNVQATLEPLRIVLALLLRLWQTFAYMNLYLLSLAALFAMWLPALREDDGERPRILIDLQIALAAIIFAYVVAMAVVGGAELARYMLPVVPLVIIVFVSTCGVGFASGAA